MITRELAYLAILGIVACGDNESPRDVWVATDGNDAWSGTYERPFRTLYRARDAVREIHEGAPGDVRVIVRDGRYELGHTLALDDRDFGMTIVADAGAHPVFSGGRVVDGWIGNGTLWAATLPILATRQLWIDDVRQPRARGPVGDATIFGDLQSFDGVAGFTMPALPASFSNPSDLEVGFFLTWQHKSCGVSRIDEVSDGFQVVMDQPCFFLAHNHVRLAVTPSYFENARELIDEPGEWSTGSGVILYKSPAGLDVARARVVVPALEELVHMQGAHDVTFEGITFAESSWLRPTTYGNPDVQAGFVSDARDPSRMFWRGDSIVNIHDEYWKTSGAVILDGAHDVRFERCTFTRLGGAGVDLVNGAHDNMLVGNRFIDISANGIQVGDVRQSDHHPDDPSLVIRNNVIANNVIRRVGAQYEDSVAIFVGYTDGTQVVHNDIADIPYTAISVGWGWGETDAGGGAYMQPFFYDTPTPSRNNLIAHNEIANILQTRSDGGAIYTLGNQPGTLIEANHVRHAGGFPGGIYLDEGSGFIEVRDNSVSDVPVAFFEHNFAQDRNLTCNTHDNHFDADVDVGAGLEPQYRDLLDD